MANVNPAEVLARDPLVARLFLAVVGEPYTEVERGIEKLQEVLGEEFEWNHGGNPKGRLGDANHLVEIAVRTVDRCGQGGSRETLR